MRDSTDFYLLLPELTLLFHSLSAVEKQNQQLEQELKNLKSPPYHRSDLRQLEEQNAKLKAEVNQAKARELKMQNRRLTLELKSLQENGKGHGRTSSLASYSAFDKAPMQKLAWYGPKDKYGSLAKVPGFNPLSIVTRSDKTIDPDFRPPLRVCSTLLSPTPQEGSECPMFMRALCEFFSL